MGFIEKLGDKVERFNWGVCLILTLISLALIIEGIIPKNISEQFMWVFIGLLSFVAIFYAIIILEDLVFHLYLIS